MTAAQVVRYPSHEAGGFTDAEVVRVAPDEEQWLTCPNCDQQAVPAPGRHHGFQQCPRCRAFVRWPDLPPLLYVRPLSWHGRGKPFLVRPEVPGE